MAKFQVIYYITLVCPTLEASLQKIEEYIAHGAKALQIDMPSREPTLETPFVAEMMAEALKKYHGYDHFMAALMDVRKRHPDVEIHLVLYPDVIESIGIQRFVEFFKAGDFSSLMLVSADAPLRDALCAAGIPLLSYMSKDMPQQEVMEAAQLPATDVLALNYRQHVQSARTEYPSYADKIRYLREQGIRTRLFAVEGIATPEMMREVCDAGTDGALVGNVLMRLWDNEDKLWELFKQFQKVAQVD